MPKRVKSPIKASKSKDKNWKFIENFSFFGGNKLEWLKKFQEDKNLKFDRVVYKGERKPIELGQRRFNAHIGQIEFGKYKGSKLLIETVLLTPTKKDLVILMESATDVGGNKANWVKLKGKTNVYVCKDNVKKCSFMLLSEYKKKVANIPPL